MSCRRSRSPVPRAPLAPRAATRRTSASSTAGAVGPIESRSRVALDPARARRAPGARASSRWIPVPDFGAISTTCRALEAQPAVDEALAGLRDPGVEHRVEAVVVDRQHERDLVVAHPAQHGPAELVERVVTATGLGAPRARSRARRRADRSRSGSTVSSVRPGLHADRECARAAAALAATAASASGSDIPLASTSPIRTPGRTSPFSTIRSVSAKPDEHEERLRDPASRIRPGALVVPGAFERGTAARIERRKWRAGARRGGGGSRRSERNKLPGEAHRSWPRAQPGRSGRYGAGRRGVRVRSRSTDPEVSRWPSRAHHATPRSCGT